MQEWKNLLLRGGKSDEFQKYEQAFRQESAATRSLAEALLRDVNDPEAHQEIQDFLTAHQRMGQGYAAAIQAFGKSNGLAFAEADAHREGAGPRAH